ncbi:uncharacterized protein PG998_009037 [Apiospora kogelbergensis]|uniref:uncharacterized protein n=1 Tax=Apiospora kogelbergensis TaxID=1337665 RepID=UPI0031326F41
MAGAAPNSTTPDPSTAANAGSIATGIGIALAVALGLIFLITRTRNASGALGALRETTSRTHRNHGRGLDCAVVNSFPIAHYKQPRLSTHKEVGYPQTLFPIDEEAGEGAATATLSQNEGARGCCSVGYGRRCVAS